jgi:hypothetical protein
VTALLKVRRRAAAAAVTAVRPVDVRIACARNEEVTA